LFTVSFNFGKERFSGGKVEAFNQEEGEAAEGLNQSSGAA